VKTPIHQKEINADESIIKNVCTVGNNIQPNILYCHPPTLTHASTLICIQRTDESTPLCCSFSLDSGQSARLVERAGVFTVVREYLSVIVWTIRYISDGNDELVPVPPRQQLIYFCRFLDVIKKVEYGVVKPMGVGNRICARERGGRGQRKANLAIGMVLTLRRT
jgi:hypothetical protein